MKQRIKNGVLSTLLLSTVTATPVIAAQSYDTSSFDGFYVGGNLGGSFTSARTSSAVSARFVGPISSFTFPVQNNSTFSHATTGAQRKNRFAAGLYAGYGFVYCDTAYLGIEAFLNFSRYKTKTRPSLNLTSNFNNSFLTLPVNFSDGIHSRLRLQNYEGGADLRPGVFLAPCTLLYGRIGVGYNKLKLHSSFNDNFFREGNGGVNPIISLSPSFIQTLERHRHKKLGSLRLGLGLEQNLCENLTIRADYVYSNYRSVKAHADQYFTDGTFTATVSHRVEVRRFTNNTVTLGLSYYW